MQLSRNLPGSWQEVALRTKKIPDSVSQVIDSDVTILIYNDLEEGQCIIHFMVVLRKFTSINTSTQSTVYY